MLSKSRGQGWAKEKGLPDVDYVCMWERKDWTGKSHSNHFPHDSVSSCLHFLLYKMGSRMVSTQQACNVDEIN